MAWDTSWRTLWHTAWRVRFVFAGLFLSLVFVLSGPVQAQRHVWFDPRFEASAGLTDNVFLTETGRLSDLVWTVSPGLNFRAQSRRLQFAADYNLDYLLFYRDGASEARHSVYTVVDAEAVEDHVFLTGRATLTPTFVDRRGSLSGSNLNRSDNRRLVQNYMGQVRLRANLKNIATWRASYRIGARVSSADQIDPDNPRALFADTLSHEYSAVLDSGERFGRLTWRLRGDGQRVFRNLGARDFKRDTGMAEAEYQLFQWLRMIANAGWSRNNLTSVGLREEGFTWLGGFRWTPGRKLDMSVRHGRMGNRKTSRILFRYLISLRLELSGQFRDSVTSSAVGTNNNLQGLRFNRDLGLVGPDGRPVDDSLPSFSLTDIDFRQKTGSGTLTWRGKRSQFFLSGDFEERTFEGNQGVAKSWGVGYGLERQVDRRTELVVTGRYRRNGFEDGNRSDSTILFNAAIHKNLYKNLRFSLSYSYSQRFSNVTGGDLKENALIATARMIF